MTPAEQQLLADTYATAQSVFEWGMGSSTVIASQLGVNRLTAVDSVLKWVEECREKIIKEHPWYRLTHAFIGQRLQAFGNPEDRTSVELWPYYQVGVISSEQPFDVYLVDGRFRVACACIALLHGHAGSKFLIHDFKRKDYWPILDFAEKVTQVESLVVLQRKPSATDAAITALWERYKLEKS